MDFRRSRAAAIGGALLVSYVVTLVLLIVVAFLLYKLKLQPAQAGLTVVLIYILAAMAGGFLTAKAVKQKRLLCGLGFGALYFGVLFFLSVIAQTGLSASPGQAVRAAICCLVGGVIGAVMG